MLSFEGLESSLLLATDFWTRLQGAVPGELVVGVPARDVVIVTGSQSRRRPGEGPPLRRAHLLRRRREPARPRTCWSAGASTWEPFDRPARPAAGPASARPTSTVSASLRGSSRSTRPGPASGSPRCGPPTTGARPDARPRQPCAAAHTGPARRRCPMPARPTHAGSMPALPAHTGSMPAVPAAHRPVADQHGLSSAPAAPRQRTASPAAHADVAQYSAVPYSAMPYSASPSGYLGAPQSPVPHSPAQPMSPYAAAQYAAAQAAAQYSAVPYSAVPYSAMPYSAVPNSGSPYSIAPSRSTGDHSDRKPEYRDDMTSTSSSLPRAMYPEYDRMPDRAAQDSYGRQDSYPSRDRDAYERPAERRRRSTRRPGVRPRCASPARSEFRSGPRARFAR